MTSWRDSSDPRCPECGGKITATATYCMHCDADLEPDDGASETEYPDSVDADVGSGDDVSYGTDQSDQTGTSDDLGFSIGDESNVGTGSSEQADVGIESSEQSDVGIESTDQPDVGIESGEQAQVGGRPQGEVEPTTLLLRGPVSILVAFPAALLIFFGSIAGEIPMAGGLLIFAVAWIGVAAYLLRKPLASDAIGDAFYVYAGVLLLIPPVWVLGDLVELALGKEINIVDTAGAAVAIEFFLFFPAGFLLLLGYGANYYAKQKIEAALGEQSANRAG